METFVVRIWVPIASGRVQTQEELRGFVEHARSGDGAAFASRDALLDSLDALLCACARESDESAATEIGATQ